MAKFWKDYAHLCKESGEFYKKHWLGVIVLNVVIVGGELVYFGRDQIKSKLKEKFHKEES